MTAAQQDGMANKPFSDRDGKVEFYADRDLLGFRPTEGTCQAVPRAACVFFGPWNHLSIPIGKHPPMKNPSSWLNKDRALTESSRRAMDKEATKLTFQLLF